MANINLVLSETGSRVIDPTVDSIWRQVLTQIGVIQYFDNHQIYIDNDRSASSLAKDDDGNANLLQNRVDIAVDTFYNPTDQHWNNATDYNTGVSGTASRYANLYRSILLDTVSNVSVQEITQPFGMTLSFKLTFLSSDVAQQAISALYSQNTPGSVTHVNDIVYSYPLDMNALVILWAVFKNKTDYPTKDPTSFIQYLQDSSQAEISFNIRREAINGNGTNPESQLVVKRHQMNCQAQLNFDQQKPVVEKQDQLAESYTVEFTYQIQFGRPAILQFTIPPIIDQTPLPYGFFKDSNEGFVKRLQGGMQTQCFDTVARYLYGGMYSSDLLIRVPPHDSWVVPSNTLLADRKFNAFFVGIIMINPGQPAELNLNELGGITLGDFVKTIMAEHSQDDIFGYGGLFNISFFCNDIPLDDSIISWDPATLTASFTGSRVHGIYRAVISETTDLRQVDPKWYPVLLKYRYYFPMTVFRNLNFLVSMGYYAVTPGNELLSLINRVKQRGAFDQVVAEMIKSGECDTSIYQYTQTTEQFADYISNTQSKIPSTGKPLDIVGKVLFNTFLDVCILKKYVSPTNLPSMYLRTPKGYPYGPGQGGFPNLQIPLRIMYVNIATQPPSKG